MAFKLCQALKAFPAFEKLTTIRNNAFEGCSGFTNLVLPDSVVYIGESAFATCTGITSLTLPVRTEDIRSKAFDGCTNLKNVYSFNPNGVDAEDDSFGDGASQITLYVPSEEAKANYSDKPWTNFEIIVMNENKIKLCFYVNDNKTPLDSIVKNVGSAISDEMEAINNKVADLLTEVNGEFSGWNEDLPETMPNGDKDYYGYISYLKEDNGFKWHLYPAENLTQKSARAILISLTDLKAEETDIVVPPTVSDTEKINLELDTVNYDVKVIASNAFENCRNITNVTLPDVDNLEIESAAFKDCSSLQQVKNFPNNMTVIRNYLFSGCSSLAQIHVRGTADDTNSLPTTITEIGRDAFRGCSSFMLKALPSALKTIGYRAFSRSGINSISFPTSLETIGYQAFYGTNLERISIPKTIEKLNNGIFRECKKLKTVVFEDGITLAVPDSTFMNCTKLDSVILSKSIPMINQSAFKGCSSLANITIPALVGFISNEAFAGCNKLMLITEERVTPPFAAESAFDSLTYAKANLYVPKDSFDAYSSAETWKLFKNKIRSEKYQLIYKLDGTVIDSLKVNAGAAVVPAADPDKDLYNKDNRKFEGWENEPTVMPDHDVTVTGSLEYYVTYYKENAEDIIKVDSVFFDHNIVIPVDTLSVSERKFTITFYKIIKKKKDTGEDEYEYEEYKTVTQDEVATTEIKMPANDIRAIVTYAQSEVEVTEGNLNYRIVDMNTDNPHAELIDSPNAKDNPAIRRVISYNGKNYPVTVIADRAFRSNKNLITITIPESIDSIGTSVFAYCFKLKNCYLTDANITILPQYTFSNCNSLVDVTLPSKLEIIGDEAFSGCGSLNNITLPSTLRSIGKMAFLSALLGDEATLTIVEDEKVSELPSADESTFDERSYSSVTLKTKLPRTTSPWNLFEKIDASGTGMDRCAKPTITFENKKLVFKCDEAGATIVYKIVVGDQSRGETAPGGEALLKRDYSVTAYAIVDGKMRSEDVTEVLHWYSKGDVTDDGSVTVADAVEVVKMIMEPSN